MTAPSPSEALARTWGYCVSRDWTGHDPFDGLMATRFPATLLRASAAGRLALLQAVKRSPFDLRGLLGVPPLRNPKALALGLESALLLAPDPAWGERALAEARRLAAELPRLATPTAHGHGWGYPFDWQARGRWIRRGVPTSVCTGFVVRALDAARGALAGGDPALARAAADAMRPAAAFVLHDLRRTADADGFCWSYSPDDDAAIVNATLLAAETVARVAALDGESSALDAIAPTIRWALARQNGEGGWTYGEAGHHAWEDGFHTAFNLASLEAIRAAAAALGTDAEALVPQERLDRGHAHYAAHFFDADGRPWYYRHTPWPIDAHSAAVAIITLARLGRQDAARREQAARVARWTVEHLWLPEGWFAYQLRPRGLVKTPFLRWCQAWMLRALAELNALERAP